LLAATAAATLRLGLLLGVEWGQDGECLGHGVRAWWCWSLLEEWTGKLVVKVLAKEVGVADVG